MFGRGPLFQPVSQGSQRVVYGRNDMNEPEHQPTQMSATMNVGRIPDTRVKAFYGVWHYRLDARAPGWVAPGAKCDPVLVIATAMVGLSETIVFVKVAFDRAEDGSERATFGFRFDRPVEFGVVRERLSRRMADMWLRAEVERDDVELIVSSGGDDDEAEIDLL